MDIFYSLPLEPSQLKFLIVGVDYFIKYLKFKVVSKITTKWLVFIGSDSCASSIFLDIIISDNGAQFSSCTMVVFYHDLGMQMKFISVFHPQVYDPTWKDNTTYVKKCLIEPISSKNWMDNLSLKHGTKIT